MPNLLIATNDGIHLAALGALGEVDRILLECFLLAHGSRGDSTAGFAGGRAAAGLETVVGLHSIFGRCRNDLGEALGQLLDLDLVELGRHRDQGVA